MYEVLVERTAERDLKSLPSTVLDRIVARIKALAEFHAPPDAISWPVPEMIGEFGSGIYRVLYEIDDSRKRVRIFRIRHRREVYR